MGQEDRISREQLKRAVGGDMDKLVAEVLTAVNEARAGAVIADSEEVVRDAMARFRQIVYEKAVQLRADAAAKAAFSPSAQRADRPAGSQQRCGER